MCPTACSPRCMTQLRTACRQPFLPGIRVQYTKPSLSRVATVSYNLVHTTNAPQPSLADTHAAVNALRHALLSWKQANSDRVPRKILYLLDNQYPEADLKGSALEGVDAHKLAILEALAKQLGFNLGLASLECHLIGSAERDNHDDDDCLFGRRYERVSDSEDSESVKTDDLEFAKIDTREASVTGLVKVRVHFALIVMSCDILSVHS